MYKILGLLSGLAVAVASIVVLIGYRAASGTSLGSYIEDHFDVILAATGAIGFGICIVVIGVMVLYNSFNPLSFGVGIVVIVFGILVVVLGADIIRGLADTAPVAGVPASAVPR